MILKERIIFQLILEATILLITTVGDIQAQFLYNTLLLVVS